jgi:hypothetical protein
LVAEETGLQVIVGAIACTANEKFRLAPLPPPVDEVLAE